ncbi:erythromycin esterase family protein [Kutzneria kofuensis]|uniref:Erythromycin esterase n=1 Tax=Kutzneria kofuensis TaxID=103725 RepID=A0A7W9NN32_9PSEU|nr:erythromycin esterase family protein [Kutzneria kofuensis]MBB5897998.1 erythromycin esterase [Kutzneria kofuensis]
MPHVLRTLDPGDEDFSDLEPLREIIGDARVVAIGESTHRVHEFYQLRHRLTRFLVRELGFGAFVMESGFPEGLAVNDWVLGGSGDLDSLLHDGITYRFGRCAEMRDHLSWMRSHGGVRFYGMDIPGSSGSTVPAIEACLPLLDEVDPAYAHVVRSTLLPLFSYLPTDRSGRAWVAPALQAYMALEPAVRYELTARIAAFSARLHAMRVAYSSASRMDSSPTRSSHIDAALHCATLARHMDAFLAAMPEGATRTYPGANIRDAAMAETIEWILRRESRIIVTAANGHIQRSPLWVPPIINDPLTTLGQHLSASLGPSLVVIGTAFGGGVLQLHRPLLDGPPGHTELFTQSVGPFSPSTLDGALSSFGLPLHLTDLRSTPVPATHVMNGPQPQPLDPSAAFDAVVYIDSVTPWHAFPTA